MTDTAPAVVGCFDEVWTTCRPFDDTSNTLLVGPAHNLFLKNLSSSVWPTGCWVNRNKRNCVSVMKFSAHVTLYGSAPSCVFAIFPTPALQSGEFLNLDFGLRGAQKQMIQHPILTSNDEFEFIRFNLNMHQCCCRWSFWSVAKAKQRRAYLDVLQYCCLSLSATVQQSLLTTKGINSDFYSFSQFTFVSLVQSETKLFSITIGRLHQYAHSWSRWLIKLQDVLYISANFRNRRALQSVSQFAVDHGFSQVSHHISSESHRTLKISVQLRRRHP